MSGTIHPAAFVANGAKVGSNVFIGPYCVVGEHVTLGDNVRLVSHVAVDGRTEIGDGTEIFPFASIGHRPQDLKFKGENSRLIIGKRNVIREHVTMNPGTEGGGLITTVGDDCLFMASSHVAHDCVVGSHVILANNATLAGHVQIGNGVIIGGLSAVHQFVRIGDFAFVGGMTGLVKDLIPFGMATENRGALDGLNLVGLKRRNVARANITQLRETYKKLFFGEGTFASRAAAIDANSLTYEAKTLLDFVTSDSSRSFCTPTQSKSADSREAA